MGKSKPPNKPGRGAFNQGLAAYQRTIKKEADPEQPVPRKDAESGLVKTGDGAGTEPPNSANPPREAVPPRGLPSPGWTSGFFRQAPEGQESKYRRVAKFLILIGGEEASKILANLDQEQIEAISLEIALVPAISADEAEEIFQEFRSLLSHTYGYSGGTRGGVDTARRILYAAFGPEKGEILLRKTVPEAKEQLFDFLEDFSAEQIFLLLKEESAGMIALVLSRLSSPRAAAVMANLSPEKKLEVAKRIARMNRSTEDVLRIVANGLKDKARRWSEAGGLEGSPELDGRGVLAEILKHTDISFEDRILNELEELQPDLGRELKDRLYTLEDVVGADDRAIQEKLRTMTDREIAMLIKGRSQDFIEKILANMTATRRAQVREERVILGTMLKKETDPIVQDFIAWFREGRESGKIRMNDDEDVLL